MKPVLVVLLWGIVQAGGTLVSQELPEQELAALVRKDSLRLLITDSGLGGLSVVAEIDALARRTRAFRHLDIVFCNALPESDYGYNSMTSDAERIAVFDAALRAMARAYDPDVILLACNTLSVVYPKTVSARELDVPVVDIVSIGVDVLASAASAHPDASVLLFGTPTTISAGDHTEALVARGVAADRILSQDCGELASEIQLDARSDMVGTMIDLYAEEAASKLGEGSAPVVAGLVCTHYGYREQAFATALRGRGIKDVLMIDPNHAMSALLFDVAGGRSFERSTVSVSVVSRAELTAGEVMSVSELVRSVSPATAAALGRYERKPDLFPFERRHEGVLEQ